MKVRTANPLTRWKNWDWVFLVIYAVTVLIVTGHHEPWRDEADAWLVVRDNDLAGLWRLTGYMGTPALWYIILMAFERLSMPYESAMFINASIAIVAVGILLVRAPFPLWVRVLIAFSYFPAYEYAAIARSYSPFCSNGPAR